MVVWLGIVAAAVSHLCHVEWTIAAATTTTTVDHRTDNTGDVHWHGPPEKHGIRTSISRYGPARGRRVRDEGSVKRAVLRQWSFRKIAPQDRPRSRALFTRFLCFPE